MEYTLTQANFKRLKAKLKAVVKTKNSNNIILACDEAESIFKQQGYPDCWNDWTRAREDAEFAQRLATGYW